MFSSRYSRFIAWIAAFAVMLAALAPTLTHVLSWVGGTQMKWVEVCTAAGVKLVVSDDGSDPAVSSDGGAGGGQVVDHCPYCSLYAGSFALPPADAPALRVSAGGESLLSVFFQIHLAFSAWTNAQPRAPPHAA